MKDSFILRTETGLFVAGQDYILQAYGGWTGLFAALCYALPERFAFQASSPNLQRSASRADLSQRELHQDQGTLGLEDTATFVLTVLESDCKALQNDLHDVGIHDDSLSTAPAYSLECQAASSVVTPHECWPCSSPYNQKLRWRNLSMPRRTRHEISSRMDRTGIPAIA